MNNQSSWVKSTCAYCGVGCGIKSRINNQGQLDIKGDEQHPANKGKLCAKALTLTETLTNDNRMLIPQILNKPVSWNEALDETVTQLQSIINRYGPSAVAFYVSGQLLTEDYYVVNKLAKGFIGTANIDTNSRLCMSSAVAGHQRAFGEDCVAGCYDDLEAADVVILTGSNLAWCHPILFQRLKLAQQQHNTKIVVIDPRHTASCDIADLHLAITPGSDIALFNGLLNYLNNNNYIDQEYINAHTNNIEAALTTAATLSNDENVSQLTGISAEKLRTFYQLFANHPRTVTVYSQGVNQSISGTDKVNAIINCHLATGRIGKLGATPFSITGQPNAMGGREVGGLATTLAAHLSFERQDHWQLLSDFWQTNNLATKPGLKAVDMFDAIANGTIKAVWIIATNPAASLPNSNKINRALAQCPCVIVSDCVNNNDTLRHATIKLPAQGWSEKSGTVTNSERYISRQRRLLPTQGEAKPDWWIITQVAQRMGFGDSFNYTNEAQIFAEHVALTATNNHPHQTPRLLNLSGLSHLTAHDYDNLLPQQWPINDDGINQQRLFSDGIFPTQDGKACFIATPYRPPITHHSTAYPLLLNTGRIRDQWHTMTRTGLSASLAGHIQEPLISVHPTDADHYKLSNNQLVTVTSQYSKAIFRVRISTEVKPRQVFIAIHWTQQTSSSGSVCALIDEQCDPISGQPQFKATAVQLTPLTYTTDAILTTTEAVTLADLPSPTALYWVCKKVKAGYQYCLSSNLTPSALEQILMTYFMHPAQHHLRAITHNSRRAIVIENNRCISSLLIRPYSNSHYLTSSSNIIGYECNELKLHQFLNGEDNLTDTDIVCACKQITKQQLIDTITNKKVQDVSTLSRITTAGTGCGGCWCELESLLNLTDAN
ncbi:nitrate reductase [Photobacterium kishitanii]|uniref:Nitrate reductase n=1 Tax=Photobacterium kishitanii TaxID=318456 RepID=A0AAX0Z2G3_9GAMM|nr:nitrate reductase [Photobacterium kishitanii]KJG58723.1 nitrate reductase [Photobacterium kishitanii]KJG62757.1 nitrate reductase [Photobacterium kishitanii]KJG66646.1 nitrate reductase [Photobacterium kishitanii]KJG70999.1 nitrate reductase [Photobacterium kishitanii]PSX21403.1 nitrate reductase [Photobacterium kishitanii]